jgi:hypothetical protein
MCLERAAPVARMTLDFPVATGRLARPVSLCYLWSGCASAALSGAAQCSTLYECLPGRNFTSGIVDIVETDTH